MVFVCSVRVLLYEDIFQVWLLHEISLPKISQYLYHSSYSPQSHVICLNNLQIRSFHHTTAIELAAIIAASFICSHVRHAITKLYFST